MFLLKGSYEKSSFIAIVLKHGFTVFAQFKKWVKSYRLVCFSQSAVVSLNVAEMAIYKCFTYRIVSYCIMV